MTTTPLFRDTTLPLAERVQNLVDLLTTEEKISLMLHSAPPVSRLGIAGYNYWSEGLHGSARNGRSTVFPQAIGLAATWEPALVGRVATATADETRAKYHARLEKWGETGLYEGLHLWSPNINIFRDPRWGRGQETYGEDPYLTGEMGVAFVRGLQGDDPRYLKTSACAKHYAVHSGPEADRHHFDAQVSLHDLYDTYLPAFKRLVTEAKVESVMGAYNRVNGEPANANRELFRILREDWQFDGHFISDCWAILDFHLHHKVTNDVAESAALAVKMGCDLNCGRSFKHLPEALERGLLTEADIDRAVFRVLRSRFRLGEFDPPEQVPYASIPTSVVGCEAHQALARETAVKSMVLLKNNGVLPIQENTRYIYITGPNAASVEALLGNYNGFNSHMATFLEGIVARSPLPTKIEYYLSCPITDIGLADRFQIKDAKAGDVVVACMGLNGLLEGEEGDALFAPTPDREEITLPPVQQRYLRFLADHGVRIVLVLSGGSPIALGDLADLADAILFTWYPGEAAGQALADLLFGDVSPSGKLPMTFPKGTDDLAPLADYDMVGRTYRYATTEPEFPFGFGLSYTRFAYSDLVLSQTPVTEPIQTPVTESTPTPVTEPVEVTIAHGASLTLSVTVSNVGDVAGDEVVQVYLSELAASVAVPQHKLVAFQRVTIPAHQSVTLTFTLPPEAMSHVAENGRFELESGPFHVLVGGCSPSPRAAVLGAPQPVAAHFEVV